MRRPQCDAAVAERNQQSFLPPIIYGKVFSPGWQSLSSRVSNFNSAWSVRMVLDPNHPVLHDDPIWEGKKYAILYCILEHSALKKLYLFGQASLDQGQVGGTLFQEVSGFTYYSTVFFGTS